MKSSDNRVPVRLINAGEVTAKLVPGEYLAQCSSVRGSYISEPIKRDPENVEETTNRHSHCSFLAKKIKRQHRTKVHRIRSQGLDIDPNLKTVPEHLHDLYQRSSRHLTKVPRFQLASLLRKESTAFAKDGKGTGRTTLVEHDIDTGDALPIRQRVRHPPLTMRQVESDCLDEMIEDDVIEPSNSPWASPVILVRKKDGSTRFCIDYTTS